MGTNGLGTTLRNESCGKEHRGMDEYRLVELLSLEDDLLLPWLDLYETAFPPSERALVSQILRMLKDRSGETGVEPCQVIHALVDGVEYNGVEYNSERSLVGISLCQFNASLKAGFLWYLAVTPEMRGQGLGTCLYQMVCEQVFRRAEILIFEVEMPERAHTPEERQWCERRIRFYQRNGAQLLTGIHYLQTVGAHQPPLPMHLIAHSHTGMSASQVLEIAMQMFGSAIQQTGEPALI